jgi:uroporphyrinogen-III synthase
MASGAAACPRCARPVAAVQPRCVYCGAELPAEAVEAAAASRAALEAEFPAVAKAALAEDVADDSYGERLMGKLRGLVSLRRVGDVPGDTTEAKLARAEQALHAGDVGKAAELVKSLPASTNHATAAWLAKAEAQLAAKRSLDQLAAYAVNLLGTAR